MDCNNEVDQYKLKVLSFQNIEASQQAELNIKNQIIQMHLHDIGVLESEVKRYKGRSTRTVIISALIVGVVTFLSIK